ncbi:MAG: HAMP domain-containing sensor histidine kinase [bacterium]|nr:HAMP domain-containing sensor histidine kinase [bacterium]
MKEKSILKKQIAFTVVGVILLAVIAVFCYKNVENTIVENEQESLKSLAKMNAQSLQSSLEAKENLIYAVLSGDMDNQKAIEKGMLKLREKGEYIPAEELEKQETWKQEVCAGAGGNPTEVIVGPIVGTQEGYYALYMTKAVYIDGWLSGYAQIELNLDEIYADEQALSDLQMDDWYCVVKDSDGTTVMPGNYVKKELSFTHSVGNGCVVEQVYETRDGIPQNIKKLIAYETFEIGEEDLTLYIVEDYNKVTLPLERIALYFCLLGAVILILAMWFIHKITAQQKEELLLVKELQHEKVLNETMKKQEGLMQKYNHSKTMSVLTGSIAHEFNNLMTPIVLYTDLLEENKVVYSEMPEEIDELKSAAKRCEELARQLLSYSRQGKAEKVLTDYDATYAMGEAVNIIRKLLPDNIELKVNICKTQYFICGQVGALNQILLNLATNAIHAMKDGGVLSVQFGLSTEDNNKVRLVVADTGGGIPDEVKMKIFQPFFTTKQAGEGTGIGLTVVKRLTEEHGGRVRVKTETGKGTTFILDFPRIIKE